MNELNPSTSVATPAPFGADEPPLVSTDGLVCQILRQVADLLRKWKKSPQLFLAAWLEEGQGQAADQRQFQERCHDLVGEIVHQLNRWRQMYWLKHIATYTGEWGAWDDAELPEVFAVRENLLQSDVLLCTAAPIDAGIVDDLLNGYCRNTAAYRELGNALGTSIFGGVVTLYRKAQARGHAGLDAVRGDLTVMHQRAAQAEDQLNKLAKLAAIIPPRPLQECVQTLFGLPAPTRGYGCLTPDYEVRLFHQLPELAKPYLSRQPFDDLKRVIEELRTWTRGYLRAETQQQSLGWLLVRLHRLGKAANELRPFLTPRRGPDGFRRWLVQLFANVDRLACLAEKACPPVRHEAPDRVTPVGEPEPISPGPFATPASETPATTADPAPASPTEPSPAELRFAELARKHPESVGSLEKVANEAVRARSACHAAGWKEASDALEAVRAKFQQFKDWLVIAGEKDAVVDLLRDRLPRLTDELLGILILLDRQLPGEGEDGPLASPGPLDLQEQRRRELSFPVKRVRDGIFDFMKQHGGYRLYEVSIGDSMARHGGQLDIKGDVVARQVKRNLVAQILQPGYRLERGPRREVAQRPTVMLAK